MNLWMTSLSLARHLKFYRLYFLPSAYLVASPIVGRSCFELSNTARLVGWGPVSWSRYHRANPKRLQSDASGCGTLAAVASCHCSMLSTLGVVKLVCRSLWDPRSEIWWWIPREFPDLGKEEILGVSELLRILCFIGIIWRYRLSTFKENQSQPCEHFSSVLGFQFWQISIMFELQIYVALAEYVCMIFVFVYIFVICMKFAAPKKIAQLQAERIQSNRPFANLPFGRWFIYFHLCLPALPLIL